MLYFFLSILVVELGLIIYILYFSVFQAYLSSRRYKIFEEVAREKGISNK